MNQNNNPFLNAFSQNQAINTGNPVLNMLINSPKGQAAMNQIQQLMQQTNQNPQQLFMSLMQSGKFNQDQINSAVQTANSFFGRRY